MRMHPVPAPIALLGGVAEFGASGRSSARRWWPSPWRSWWSGSGVWRRPLGRLAYRESQGEAAEYHDRRDDQEDQDRVRLRQKVAETFPHALQPRRGDRGRFI